MKKHNLLVGAVVVLLMALLVSGCTNAGSNVNPPLTGDEAGGSLLVYCGAGLREPMDEIAEVFSEKEGISIDYTYGGSAQLLSQIELVQKGDAYMPGAKSYIDSAAKKGFIDQSAPTVYHVLAIVTGKGNPKNIQTLEDLTREGIRVAIGEPTGPAVGTAAKSMLEKDGLWEDVEKNCVVKSGTVNELLVYISMDQADAAIIWEDLFNPETMEKVDIPIDKGFIKVIPIGTLSFSENPGNAEKFMNFVSSDEGKAIFEKHGFETYPSEKYESM
ncbi:MAG: molybdate ABC transporter substrate-binding protein [Methanomicrobiaceae archaeon]|nr:molybdate ABC transporter substrate-binding protein [Methanomicrobiaceae archaeon]